MSQRPLVFIIIPIPTGLSRGRALEERIAAPVCTPRALASRRGLARNDRVRRGERLCPPVPCHSEPVRTLAWESVSPRLPLRGRCQRKALTEGEMPRVFLPPSRLRRQPPPRGGLTARRCRADGTSGRRPLQQTTRRPLWGAARFPSMCGTDGGGLYSPLLQAGTASSVSEWP